MPEPFPFDDDEEIVNYPGTLYPLQMLADVINASWREAQLNQEQYSAKISDATSGWLDTLQAPAIVASTAAVPAITDPEITIPVDEQVDDIMQQWEVRTAELSTTHEGKVGCFMAQSFPT